jgi:muramoyltetrapeptide carboxypeptidase
MHPEPESVRLPRALQAEGAIGVVSTASPVEASALETGCRRLEEQTGWRTIAAPSALSCEHGFAGTAQARADALMESWRREDVDAIVCSRGGYGTNYLLPLLDFEALRIHPKPFVGYSDNTALLLALQRAALVAFHGPMVASDFATGRADAASFRRALSGEAQQFRFAPGSPVRSLVAGEARGAITGGCLSVVVTSLGTPWEIETADKIVFLEDVHEKLFRLDRMLRHLLLAGKFRGVRGVIFGAMPGCGESETNGCAESETLAEMILRVLGPLGIPIALGFPSGHVESGNLTIPFGVPAALRSSQTEVCLEVEAAALPTFEGGQRGKHRR